MNKLVLAAGQIAVALAACMALPACSEKQPPPQTESVQVEPTPAPAVTAEPAPPAPAPAPPGAADQMSFTPEALETLLAPIALFPDPVLAQVLATSTNPQEVLDAGNWLLQNADLKGKELEAAGTAVGFTPPMLALIQFPTVVDMMCMEMDWTTELGVAFQADEPGVLAAVQRLRAQATEMGNLKSSEQMTVATETQDDQQIIVVQPANPEVVYVPQYNPAAVYTTPAPATSTAVATTTTSSGYTGGEMVATGLLAFGAGILVNEVFDDDDDDHYYPRYGYGGGGYYPPPYYPRYGNGYRPASGYNRPSNYKNSFNNNNIYIDADGRNSFDRFDRGQNNYRKNPRSPISTARPNRPELGGLNRQAQTASRPASTAARKPQGTYARAKPAAAAQRPAAQRPAVNSRVPGGTYAGAANPAARSKASPQTAGARDRGRRPDAVGNSAARKQSGAKPVAQPKTTAKRTPTANRTGPKKQSAFKGSRNSGKSERAASKRGRSSMGKSGQKRGAKR